MIPLRIFNKESYKDPQLDQDRMSIYPNDCCTPTRTKIIFIFIFKASRKKCCNSPKISDQTPSPTELADAAMAQKPSDSKLPKTW